MKVLLILTILAAVQLSPLAQSVGTNAPQVTGQAAMPTRVYRLDGNTFTAMRRFIEDTNNLPEGEVLRRFCMKEHIDVSPPAYLFYTVGQKTLVVRSTLDNLGKIERFLGDAKRVE
jgi:hypothetical protein